MKLHSFLSKIRNKILRLLLGESGYKVITHVNEHGSWYLIQKYAPETKYPEILCDWYFEKTGEKLNLEAPRTFNEKIQWLKLYDATPLKTRLSDKYLVRQWVADKIGEKYLIPLLGVWDSFDEIDFDLLPNQFVLKANHGSGWNIIVKDKSKFDRSEARKKFSVWMNTNFAYSICLELQYRDITPKILAEKYLEDKSGGLVDYKFYCFEGNPFNVGHYVDRYKKGGYKAVNYDMEWNPTPWTTEADHKPGIIIKKPEMFNEMLGLANTLCIGFHHVRVDFYLVNNQIYFGEMTFSSGSGLDQIEPDEWNRKLGDMIKLPTD